MITIFTTPKPFAGDIGRIQRNAIWSWLALGAEVEVLLIGEEEGMAQAAAELGVRMLPEVERNEHATPLVSSIFSRAQEAARHDLLLYANADIVFFPDLLPAARRVHGRFDRFLVVGQRWDVELDEEWHLEEFADEEKRSSLLEGGSRHPRTGSDYFLFARGQFEEMPPFALGRSGWDNWMIYAGRASGWPVIDGSEAITVVHQDHDYGHLPGGESHYRLPESHRNVRLAGGREMMFTLADTTWRLAEERILPKTWWEDGPFRRLESSLYAAVGPGRASKMVRVFFHPREALTYLAGRLASSVHPREQERPSLNDRAMIESGTPDRSEPHEV